jgi:hypothetical protein
VKSECCSLPLRTVATKPSTCTLQYCAPRPWCFCLAVVFGRVTEGQGLLQKVNAVGTRSGKPKQRVVVVDCGELPSKRQIMLKLQVRVICASLAIRSLFTY